jgi:hypothetical protein
MTQQMRSSACLSKLSVCCGRENLRSLEMEMEAMDLLMDHAALLGPGGLADVLSILALDRAVVTRAQAALAVRSCLETWGSSRRKTNRTETRIAVPPQEQRLFLYRNSTVPDRAIRPPYSLLSLLYLSKR